jgi:hypothetical protein
MKVRANEIAFRELLLEQTGAAAPRERREVIHFRGAGSMNEGHRDRMERVFSPSQGDYRRSCRGGEI